MAPQRPLPVVISIDYLLLGIKTEKVEKSHLKNDKITTNPFQFRKTILLKMFPNRKRKMNMILLLCTFLQSCLKMEQNCSAELKQ